MKTKVIAVILFVILLIYGVNDYFYAKGYTRLPLTPLERMDFNVMETNRWKCAGGAQEGYLTTTCDIYDSEEGILRTGYPDAAPALLDFDFENYNLLLSPGRKILDLRYQTEATKTLRESWHNYKVTFDGTFDNDHLYVYRIAKIPLGGESTCYAGIHGLKVPLEHESDMTMIEIDWNLLNLMEKKKKAEIIIASFVAVVFLTYGLNDWRKRKKALKEE